MAIIFDSETANFCTDLKLNGAMRFAFVINESYFQYHVLHFGINIVVEEFPIKIQL